MVLPNSVATRATVGYVTNSLEGIMRSAVTRTIKSVVATGAVAAAVAGVGLAGSAPAAAHKDGRCDSGDMCLYYLTGFRGPIFDLFVSDNDFSDDRFPGTSIPANDNTESGSNHDTYTWYLYTGANRTGYRGTSAPGSSGNFAPTFKNTISSGYWYL
jgi:hypothetical protein